LFSNTEFPCENLTKRLSDATDADLDVVCTFAGAKYLELGLELGFRKEEIDLYEKDHIYCRPITRQILKAWVERQGPDATWGALGDALYEIRCDVQFIIDNIFNIG